MKLKQFDRVEIIWIDSMFVSNKWEYISDLDIDREELLMVHNSIGYLVKETKHSYLISMSHRAIVEDDDTSVADTFLIPKKAVVKVKIWKKG